ncbi:hypothetical protein CEXT_313311 [Caerostris extrusa]|uniref:Uncharacterized protein n=1 Tax=Caerostris extrusa TaxID=172846 RepID=A0AAV4XPN7_CAEEX|nr:hypothetical protein CEXT_313311 [Caerostris extrusa]
MGIKTATQSQRKWMASAVPPNSFLKTPEMWKDESLQISACSALAKIENTPLETPARQSGCKFQMLTLARVSLGITG